jgi:excisionase family DNA binding protein
MDRLLVKVEEAAEMLGIGRSTVYDLMRTGEIESVWIGRSRRIPVDALRDYIAQLPHAEAGRPVPRLAG